MTELDGHTLEPTGHAIDVGTESGVLRTGAGGVVAVTASFASIASDSAEIVFADLDDGRVLRRVRASLAPGAGNFSSDGRYYAIGGFDGRLQIIDVATGTIVGPEDPVHSGPVAWLTFSPDGKTLATVGFDGELALVDPATGIAARPSPTWSRQRQCIGRIPSRWRFGAGRLRGRIGHRIRHRPRGLDRACLSGRRTQPHRDGVARRLRRSSVP